MSFAKITIVGNAGKDAELKYTPQGTAVAVFTIAVNNKRGEEKTTTWFRVSAWGKQAEAIGQYVTKGKPVYIEGRLSQQEYQDKQGVTRFSLEVNATDVQFLGSRESGQEEPERAQAHGKHLSERNDNLAAQGQRPRPQTVPPASSQPYNEDVPF